MCFVVTRWPSVAPVSFSQDGVVDIDYRDCFVCASSSRSEKLTGRCGCFALNRKMFKCALRRPRTGVVTGVSIPPFVYYSI